MNDSRNQSRSYSTYPLYDSVHAWHNRPTTAEMKRASRSEPLLNTSAKASDHVTVVKLEPSSPSPTSQI